MINYSILDNIPKPSSEVISAATSDWPDLSRNPNLLTLVYLSYEDEKPHAALFVRVTDGVAELFYATSGTDRLATIHNTDHHLITKLHNEADQVAKKLGVSRFKFRAARSRIPLTARFADSRWQYTNQTDSFVEMELVVSE